MGLQKIGHDSVTEQQQQYVFTGFFPALGLKFLLCVVFFPPASVFYFFSPIDHRVDIRYRANYNEDRVILKANKYLTGTMVGEIITLYLPKGGYSLQERSITLLFTARHIHDNLDHPQTSIPCLSVLTCPDQMPEVYIENLLRLSS